jgi:outer membrane lipoprotein SlyB
MNWQNFCCVPAADAHHRNAAVGGTKFASGRLSVMRTLQRNGGLGGAAVGGTVSGDVDGALIGGAVGATAGALIGRANEPGRCYYRVSRGRRYIARCPAGY